jgi:hypothetical protein
VNVVSQNILLYCTHPSSSFNDGGQYSAYTLKKWGEYHMPCDLAIGYYYWPCDDTSGGGLSASGDHLALTLMVRW